MFMFNFRSKICILRVFFLILIYVFFNLWSETLFTLNESEPILKENLHHEINTTIFSPFNQIESKLNISMNESPNEIIEKKKLSNEKNIIQLYQTNETNQMFNQMDNTFNTSKIDSSNVMIKTTNLRNETNPIIINEINQPKISKFQKFMQNFPWHKFQESLFDVNLSMKYSQLLLTGLEPFLHLEPQISINESCKEFPELTPIESLDCEKYPFVFLENNKKLNESRKIYHAIQFGFDADTLEIMLNEIYDLVDGFFIIESTCSHCRFLKKSLTWDHIKNQERFHKFNEKIIHLIIDDVELLTAKKKYIQTNNIWHFEWQQEEKRWSKIQEWNYLNNNILKPNDLIGFGDADEIPARRNIELLKYCSLRNPNKPIDIGIWFPYGKINQTFRTDFPVDQTQPWTLGDPTYFPVQALLGPIDQTTKRFKSLNDRVSRNRGTSNNFLLGGMHMTHYGYLPMVLLKKITATECFVINTDYINTLKDMSNGNLRDMELYYSETPQDLRNRIFIFGEGIEYEKVKDVVVLPWFYNCNRNRYPVWESNHDTRLDIL